MARIRVKRFLVSRRLVCVLLFCGSLLLYVFRYVRRVVSIWQCSSMSAEDTVANRTRQDLLTDYLLRDKEAHPFQQMYSRPGKVRTCSCCGHTSTATSWKGWGKGERRAMRPRCPVCGSLERHRLLCLFLKSKTNYFQERLNVLEFTPFSKVLASNYSFCLFSFFSFCFLPLPFCCFCKLLLLLSTFYDIILCSARISWILFVTIDSQLESRRSFALFFRTHRAFLLSPHTPSSIRVRYGPSRHYFFL